MYPSLSDPGMLKDGAAHLRKSDPKMRILVKEQGVLEFKPRGKLFTSLVESIISQQLNGRVADLIIGRVNGLFLPGRLTPDKLHAVSPSKLRKAGLSPQKLSYLKDLSSRLVRGDLDLAALPKKSDEEIVSVLDDVRGIGPWTAQMVLMFSLGRPDVLPVDDYGIQKAIERVYGLPRLPDRKSIERLAVPWQPYRSLACLYLWSHKDSGL